jgi:hypothetical protein
MSYNLTLSNGDQLGTLPDGNINNNYTSLTLVGKNYAGYGVYLNENFIKLTENFAAPTEPSNALQGQIWWDTVNQSLKVKNGQTWKAVSSTTASNTSPAPSTTNVGDMWWDMLNTQLKVWSGTSSGWIVIGPAYTAAQGKTGIEASVVTEVNTNASRIILKFWVNNVLTAVLSRDSSFATNSLPGFGASDPVTINPGFNLSTGGTVPLRYYGDANNAVNLGGFPATDYLRSSQTSPTFNTALWINNNTGLDVGVNHDFTIDVNGSAVNLKGNVSGKSLSLFANYLGNPGGVPTELVTLDGASGSVLVKANPTLPLGIATKDYVDSQVSISGPALLKNGGNNITGNITPSTNNLYSFGAPTTRFDTVYATTFNGTATNSDALGGTAASLFPRLDVANTFTQILNLSSNSGVTIGAAGDFTVTVDSATVKLDSIALQKNVVLTVMTSPGAPTPALTVDGGTGLITVSGAPTTDLGIATKKYVDDLTSGGPVTLTAVNSDIIPTANVAYTVGSPTMQWSNMYATTFHGTAMVANYADLAERFEADADYAPGTVVEMGGTAEITAASTDLSDEVFGVISTKAAYLMNASAGSDATHPPVAMQGRVPVRVTGTVRKGDRLVSAGNGLARAALKSEITPFNVIGRALQNKLTNGEGTVEAIVKLNS